MKKSILALFALLIGGASAFGGEAYFFSGGVQYPERSQFETKTVSYNGGRDSLEFPWAVFKSIDCVPHKTDAPASR